MRRLARMTQELVASCPWNLPTRKVRKHEKVWAVEARNLPRRGVYWISPFNENAEWVPDAEGAYGVLAYASDLRFLPKGGS